MGGKCELFANIFCMCQPVGLVEGGGDKTNMKNDKNSIHSFHYSLYTKLVKQLKHHSKHPFIFPYMPFKGPYRAL